MTDARLAGFRAAAGEWISGARRAGRLPLLAATATLPVLVLAPAPFGAQAAGMPAVAAEQAEAARLIDVRTGTHPGYGRVVFDWPTRTDYQAVPTDDGLLIRFGSPGRVRLLGVAAPRNVTEIVEMDDAVRIATRPGVRFRHFHHGPRLVIDVLDPAAPAVAAAPPAAALATAPEPALPSAEAVIADLAVAMQRRNPIEPAPARPAILASATPGAVVSLPHAPLAPEALPPQDPAVIRIAQALPPSGPRMGVPLTVPTQTQGFTLLPQAQAQTPGIPPVPAQVPQIPGMPQVSAPQPGATLTRAIVLEQGSGRLVELPAAAVTVLVADPRIARVQPASPTSLFVMGVNAGRTNLIATREDGSLVAEFDITVQAGAAGVQQVAPGTAAAIAPVSASQVQSMIRRMVRGGQNVRVTVIGRGAIGLTGMVPTAADAQRAEAIAKAMGGEGREVINNLQLLSGIQVNLRVRVAEISREVTRDLGFNWQSAFANGLWTIGLRTGAGVAGAGLGLPFRAGFPPPSPRAVLGAIDGASATGGLAGLGYTRGNWDVNSVIDALAQDRLVTILAEPNLTAQSGEVASFLAGGEFPVPVAAGGNANALTVEFKQFGVSLSFVPTVLSPERLNMRVRPEVSELSEANSVIFPVAGGTVRIPGLSVRRAETTVELGSGQSFAIAGLLSRNAAINNSGLAGLGEIPVLGALFRSDRFRRNETELVIIITPYLVRPVSDPSALGTPLDTFRPATDLERILFRRQTGSGAPYREIRPPSASGFIVE